MYLPPTAQNIVSLALAAIWAVGMITLYFRMRAKQVAYLKRFPLVEGVPLYMAAGGTPFGAVAGTIWRVMLNRQPDPDLERLRQEIWRRFRYMALWIYGYPVVAFGVAALLITTGAIKVVAK